MQWYWVRENARGRHDSIIEFQARYLAGQRALPGFAALHRTLDNCRGSGAVSFFRKYLPICKRSPRAIGRQLFPAKTTLEHEECRRHIRHVFLDDLTLCVSSVPGHCLKMFRWMMLLLLMEVFSLGQVC